MDLVKRLNHLYVWPQLVADSHADILSPKQAEAFMMSEPWPPKPPTKSPAYVPPLPARGNGRWRRLRKLWMREIPDDVMKAAQAVVLWAYSVPLDETEHIKNVAIAILAERERCAQAAISVICNRGGQRDDELIDAIRKGTTT